MMIGDLLGFPHEMWPKLMEWSERTIVGGGGPAAATDDVVHAAVEFYTACSELYEEKRECPVDDIMSIWTKASIDDEPLALETRDVGLPARCSMVARRRRAR